MNLRQFDQNLWLVLDALYQTRSVSGASELLNLSQSAMSHALKRLRVAFDDPLFVRQQGEMKPTKKALMIQPLAQQGVALLNQVANSLDKFDVATSERQFTIATTDFITKLFVYPLIAKLCASRSNIKIKVVDLESQLPHGALAVNEIDLVLTFNHADDLGADIEYKMLLSGDYRVIARKNHSLINDELSLACYLQAHHILISPWGQEYGSLDIELNKINTKRHIAAITPHLMQAVNLVATSDLIATVPTLSISPNDKVLVNIYSPPISLPPYRLYMAWYRAFNLDPGLSWLKNTLHEIAAIATQSD
ncbi:LysR family transcriptional regulator [Pseudoalteromonas luteoviolacea]|uniref:LysR family transcriptional regulator n=1 Tax=Pseudoalteromonas luteoviolacea TaxID=43657 RepID=UPI001F166969|nr:LysR family transcriptional regulator [Pseudoalteromonas luteoviolacea]MCF6439359.1 LysR family transcriptional regulator [Pseudoalteromonas luteoviolacea]